MDLIEARQFDTTQMRRHPWEIARLAHVRDLIARRVRLAPGALVCDIGCGDTFVAEALAHDYRNVQFYAIDTGFTDESMAHLAAGHAAATTNLRLFDSTDRAAAAANAPAALILLMDVIEHVEDDLGFVRGLVESPLAAASTIVLVTVPAVPGLFSAHDRFLGHYRRYSKRSLRDVLERSGLEVLDIGSFFSTLLVARAVQARFERLGGNRRPPRGVAGWGRGPAITALVTAALRFDVAGGAKLHRAGLGLPGLSCYAVCRVST